MQLCVLLRVPPGADSTSEAEKEGGGDKEGRDKDERALCKEREEKKRVIR